MNEEKDFITAEDMIEKLGLNKKRNSFLHIVIAFLVKLTPYTIGIPILCVVNYMCYEANDRLLQPATNLIWLGMMTMFWFKYYK
tara:strand:+ start:308 stop:559 length:252 start_codon:yes stop_codon:yes gene_type:complete